MRPPSGSPEDHENNGIDSGDVCFPTLDPRQTGGVQSVIRFTHRNCRDHGLDPYVVFNAVSWDRCSTLGDISRLNFDVAYERDVYDGIPGVEIGRVLPELKIFNYLLNLDQWREAMAPASRIFGVGGTCLSCLPAAVDGRPFGCWIGTTLYDEQRDRDEQFSTARAVRDRLTLPVMRRYESLVLERAKTIVTQSEYTKRRVLDVYDVEEAKIDVVPYPVDTEQFTPGETDDSLSKITFVGRLNASRKNVPLLLRAFAIVLDSVPDATLTLIGDEPNERLKTVIRELGIEDAVEFHGQVPSVLPHLREADAFVYPSRQEGLGIAGLEAQSCGVPVVATRCGGPEEYVEDGVNGFLVPVDDPEPMADRLTRLLTDAEMRREFGANARETVVDGYSEAVVSAQLIERISEIPTQ